MVGGLGNVGSVGRWLREGVVEARSSSMGYRPSWFRVEGFWACVYVFGLSWFRV